jgi:hypothetical protein
MSGFLSSPRLVKGGIVMPNGHVLIALPFSGSARCVFETGTSGSRKFARGLAQAIGQGMKR